MTTIGDKNFCKHNIANSQDCRAVDRYLKKVDEIVTVTACCQDSNTPSLVIIDFTLAGAFEFTPSCRIIDVDGVTFDVLAPFVASHFKSPSIIPIQTNCNTYHGQIVFDFANVIPDYIQAQVITLELIMEGSIPSSYGVSFPNQTVKSTFRWEKGILPRAIGMRYENGNLVVIFDYTAGRDCSCNIQCVQPEGVTAGLVFCEDQPQKYEVLYGNLNGDPQYVSLLLRDSLNNESKLDVQGLIRTNVKPPITVGKAQPKRVELSLSRQASNGDDITEASYQIIKYEATEGNYEIWKDWSDRDWNYFVDYDVSSGMTYSYKVRYKDKLNNMSNFSDWSTVTI